MAKVTDLRINISENGEKIQFETPVNVTKEGIFTTTLPRNAVDEIEKYGVTLRTNRLGNPGYFEAKTLDELTMSVNKVCREALSRELVEDKMIIKYEIRTECSYCKDKDGTPVPNGYWLKEQTETNKSIPWVKGNGNQPNHYHTPSISVWACVFHKKKYIYKSGKEKIELERYYPNITTKNSLDWINSLIETQTTFVSRTAFVPAERERNLILERLPEVEATEKNGQFFVTMFKLIFKMNELFSDFSSPETLLGFLENYSPKNKLLESMQE